MRETGDKDMTTMAVAHRPEMEAGNNDVNSRPVDLVHLARHTLGDRDLEREVLNLFTTQSVIYLDRLKQARGKTDRKAAAHTIKGSAKGIGAWHVADCARAVEEVDGKGQGGARQLIAHLEDAISKTNGFINDILEDE